MMRQALIVAALVAVVPVAPLTAQAPAYFASLAIPPSSVGTCLPVNERLPDTLRAKLHGRRLVMASTPPGARREMTVTTDPSGAIRGYNELLHVSTGLGSGVGDAVFAARARDGHFSGFIMHDTTHIKVPAPGHFDTTAMREMRESARTDQHRVPLTTADQERVRKAAEWLLKRCRA